MNADNPLPPSSKPAEQAVLGAALRSPVAVADLVRILRVEHFYLHAHQVIFNAMLGMFHRNEPIEARSVADALHAAKQLADAGGPAYFADLLDAAPTAAN